jgi:hypothetical protein
MTIHLHISQLVVKEYLESKMWQPWSFCRIPQTCHHLTFPVSTPKSGLEGRRLASAEEVTAEDENIDRVIEKRFPGILPKGL